MVDVQRRAVLRSLAKGATASSVRSPHMYQTKTDAMHDAETDASFFSALASPSPATSTASSAHAAGHSPYAFNHSALLSASALGMPHMDDEDSLFAAYAGEPQPQELDDALRSNAWDLYYPPPAPLPIQHHQPPPPQPQAPPATSTGRAAPRAPTPATASAPPTTGRATGARQGVKRPLASPSPAASAPLPSPTVSVASSMLAMRNNAEPAAKTPAVAAASAPARSTAGRAAASTRRKKEEAAEEPPAKKTKVSRERQLKINAASRRCRKKQKLELQFLRTHVVDLQATLKEQVTLLRGLSGQHQRVARLATFLEESIRQVEDMSSGGRPGTPKTSLYSESELQQLKATAAQAMADAKAAEAQQVSAPQQPLSKPDTCSVRAIDPMTGYSLSDERKRTLLNIAAFMRNNISLESQSFSPEVISCLPIEMDGWQLRLAITEKNYTIHNCKFFPCDVVDLFDFCWDTNVESRTSIKQGKNDYCVVTPLDKDVAHVYSKTIGKWSLSVHGVANVTYNSLVCRTYNPETRRAMICQQSVLEDRDFQDESAIPWLFKRWVVFTPREVNGVQGTFVEAYRTASYATGRLIYKEDNTYDSFCEHLIRRYAESNSLLERMMARDPRFQHVAVSTPSDVALDHEETTSDRMVKDLLLF